MNSATIGRKDIQAFSIKPGELGSQTGTGLQAICSDILGLDLKAPSQVDWKNVAGQLAAKVIDQQRAAELQSAAHGVKALGAQLGRSGEFDVKRTIEDGTLKIRATPKDLSRGDSCEFKISRTDDGGWLILSDSRQEVDGHIHGSGEGWVLDAATDPDEIIFLFNANFSRGSLYPADMAEFLHG